MWPIDQLYIELGKKHGLLIQSDFVHLCITGLVQF